MNKRMKTAVGLIALGSLVVSLGTGALAGTNYKGRLSLEKVADFTSDSSTADQNVAGCRRLDGVGNQKGDGQGNGLKGGGMRGDGGCFFNTDTLETEGLISSDQATAIDNLIAEKEADRLAERQLIQNMTTEERKAYFEDKENTVRTTLQEELVSNNILTQNEMDKIEEYMKAQRLEQHQTELSTRLEPFVTDGTITQDKADEILEYLEDLQVERQAERDALKGKTAEEIKAYFDAEPKVNALTSMVTDNVITQAQADALESSFQRGPKGGRGL